MQANPTPPILPAQWHRLDSHEEIRIRQQDATIQLVSQQALHHNQAYHNHIETLYILRQVAARLFTQPIRPPEDALLDIRVDALHRRIFEHFGLNPLAAPDRTVLAPIHAELEEMIAFILKRREEKKASRSSAVPKKEASPDRKVDQLLHAAAAASSVLKMPSAPSSAEPDKHFIKVAKSLEKLARLGTKLKQQRELQAQLLSQSHRGYNPLDDNNEVPGNYFQFIHALELRTGNQESALLPCRTKVEQRLKAFLNFSLANIRHHEACHDLLQEWTKWVDNQEIDRIHFGRIVGICLSEEHMFLLLGQALKEDLANTNQLNEVFRSTLLLRGTIIGGYFTRLVQQSIYPTIHQFLMNLDKTALAEDEISIRPYVQSLLDLIRIQFLQCRFTPAATDLLNQAQLNIHEKWHTSGIRHLLATLFLRGATHVITDYSHTSPNKMAIRQLGKLLQREINLFSNWTFKEMEGHLLTLLQHHTRTYPQGYRPFSQAS